MLKKGILVWILLFPLSVWAQNDQRVIQIDPSQPEFTIRLKSNPTTGFMWALTSYDAQCLQWQGHDFEAPTNHRIGAGGVELFHFRLNPAALTTAHRGEIHFKYRRSWEKTNAGPEVTIGWSYTPKAKASTEIG